MSCTRATWSKLENRGWRTGLRLLTDRACPRRGRRGLFESIAVVDQPLDHALGFFEAPGPLIGVPCGYLGQQVVAHPIEPHVHGLARGLPGTARVAPVKLGQRTLEVLFWFRLFVGVEASAALNGIDTTGRLKGTLPRIEQGLCLNKRLARGRRISVHHMF